MSHVCHCVVGDVLNMPPSAIWVPSAASGNVITSEFENVTSLNGFEVNNLANDPQKRTFAIGGILAAYDCAPVPSAPVIAIGWIFDGSTVELNSCHARFPFSLRAVCTRLVTSALIVVSRCATCIFSAVSVPGGSSTVSLSARLRSSRRSRLFLDFVPIFRVPVFVKMRLCASSHHHADADIRCPQGGRRTFLEERCRCPMKAETDSCRTPRSTRSRRLLRADGGLCDIWNERP